MKVSVIVPVFEDWQQAGSLFEALQHQTIGAQAFDLLLVDNGSSWVPEQDTLPPNATLLKCQRPGSYAARNAGVEMAQGDLLVFTDSDCVPEPDWLEGLLKRVQSSGFDVIVAGNVVVVHHGEEPSPAALYDLMLGFPQERYVSNGYGVTANLAVKKEIFEAVGGFDAARFSGGDADFCRRAAKRTGARVIFCRDARVTHPARTRLESLECKVRRVKGGQLLNGSFRKRAAYVIRTFLPPVRALARIASSKGFTRRERLIVARVQLRLWFVEMWEVARLIFGGEPERR